jgi:DNA-directed RNA polymerase subunit RPC12/RpoP
MVKLDCPKCREPLTFPEERRGDDVRCPHCGLLLRMRNKPPSPATSGRPARSAKPAPAPESPRPAPPKPPPTDEDDVVEAAEVVRQPRRRRKRRRHAEPAGLPEWVIPLGVLVFAGVMNALLALRGGTDEGRARLIFSVISLIVTVPTTIVGLFVAAAALGANFGNIFTAAIKIAAITTVVQCIYTFGMMGGGDGSSMLLVLIALPVYWGMFMWFFDLTFVETIWATIFIGLVQRVVNTVLTVLLAGILMKGAPGGP